MTIGENYNENVNENVNLYESIYNEYKTYHNQHTDNINVPHLNATFDSLAADNSGSNDDVADVVARNLFGLLISMYDTNTENAKHNREDRTNMNQLINSQKKIIDKDKVSVDTLKQLNETNKRKIEIELYKSRKSRYTIKTLKVVLIIVGILLIIPVLTKLKIFSKAVGISLWCLALICVLCYMFFMLHFKMINKDDLEFNKLNFRKPTDEEIAKSVAMASMSEKDRARCQYLQETEQQINVQPLDINEYLTNDPVQNTCSRFAD